MLDYASLGERFGALSEEYATAKPFPHVVLDEIIPADVLRTVADEFGEPTSMEKHYDDDVQVKSTESRWEHLGPATRRVVAELNSGAFTRCLTRLTGIENLVVDADLVGAGRHLIRRGGLLKVHADFDRHVRTQLTRRLNVLVYLNDPWESDWGGALELWARDMSRAVVTVPPLLGTVVVFSTTDDSFHGHPDPLACPSDVARKSLALYYYTSPIKPDARRRTTDFRRRPGERFVFSPPPAVTGVRRFVPSRVRDIARMYLRR